MKNLRCLTGEPCKTRKNCNCRNCKLYNHETIYSFKFVARHSDQYPNQAALIYQSDKLMKDIVILFPGSPNPQLMLSKSLEMNVVRNILHSFQIWVDVWIHTDRE
jgi:hypothetical protein